jgi:phospholipid-transporting ATPase
MNATQPPSKRSRVERTVDSIILVMFATLFGMCLLGAAYFASWTARGARTRGGSCPPAPCAAQPEWS